MQKHTISDEITVDNHINSSWVGMLVLWSRMVTSVAIGSPYCLLGGLSAHTFRGVARCLGQMGIGWFGDWWRHISIGPIESGGVGLLGRWFYYWLLGPTK